MTAEAGSWLRIEKGADAVVVSLGGTWTTDTVAAHEPTLAQVEVAPGTRVRVDLAALDHLDTIAATLIDRTVRRWREHGAEVAIVGATRIAESLLDLVHRHDVDVECRPPRESPLKALLIDLGRASIEVADITVRLVAFLGLTTLVLARALVQPWRIRWTSLVVHLERTGLDALPIVGLISFLIGAVLAYQGAEQLRRFGADIFVVNLIGISVLRETGILLAAIMVAGRSGSAFTAAIGSMQVHEEVDAMRTLGLDPMEVLVVPRVIALVVALPLLAFFADIAGLTGGALMAWASAGIDLDQFVERLSDAVTLTTFWVGIVKAPVFGFLIAMIGCFEGFQVRASAESVGHHTTRSVVEAIFLVIVVDAAFSVLFATLGI